MPNSNKIRVLVADDSPFIRELVSDMLNEDPEIEVVGTAEDGEDAVSKTFELLPDVVVMDYAMPKMNGAEATKRIVAIKDRPPKVLILSAYTKEGGDEFAECVKNGAIACLLKPFRSGQFHGSIKETSIALINEVKNSINLNPNALKNKTDFVSKVFSNKVILIGSSTGGPVVLEEIFKKLPQNLNAAFLVVQHMPDPFITSFAERLNKLGNLKIKVAEEREVIQNGTVLFAPGDWHMAVELSDEEGKKIPVVHLNKEPLIHGLRPACDILMKSASKSFLGKHILGIVLTGMGTDGTEGMIAVKTVGGQTIAQDPKTAVLTSMPQSVIDAGAADKILSPDEIVKEILAFVSGNA